MSAFHPFRTLGRILQTSEEGIPFHLSEDAMAYFERPTFEGENTLAERLQVLRNDTTRW
jgi:hypothetical protein